MHAFVTRHRFAVVAILFLSVAAFLGFYARQRLAYDGARAASAPAVQGGERPPSR